MTTNMASCPVAFRVAQAVGLSGAAWLSGNIAAYSLNVAPSLLTSAKESNLPPSTLAKLWRNIYHLGSVQNPPIALTTAAAFFYLAWSVRSGTALFRQTAENAATLYCAAAVLTLSIVPFTLIAMTKTNRALLEQAKVVESEPTVVKVGAREETEQLICRWIGLNGARSLFPLAGVLVGLYAALW
ncbi:uncharacterized protein BDCG_01537 [Blastomyces dermatitidis ER-3]|uniref:DUF1772 domain-containing protein n=1 Tax=Ajellomyces dermatitidis (strain ER-3 / ATCC MYA-2586) TaxID=559297 RepID=A0ABP2ERT9_AJEDR|nr:uncharacterized protein BDCG_01537 [Blastomyces dermatitidis ER-3]EEQ86417.1 hypothetical protein BDCG_01537 [Blastomyces dermatitidis ER-3]EQL29358.1 hypothetical protein BDFG_07992 [Blastomyces dermatitidis ATCC 26199]